MIRKRGTDFPSGQTRSVCPEIMLKQKENASSLLKNPLATLGTW
jgi:hypothetical protein